MHCQQSFWFYIGKQLIDEGIKYDEPAELGSVITIEPGLYIESENNGVRMEDIFLMTEVGPQNLWPDLPSDPDEIKKMLSRER